MDLQLQQLTSSDATMRDARTCLHTRSGAKRRRLLAQSSTARRRRALLLATGLFTRFTLWSGRRRHARNMFDTLRSQEPRAFVMPRRREGWVDRPTTLARALSHPCKRMRPSAMVAWEPWANPSSACGLHSSINTYIDPCPSTIVPHIIYPAVSTDVLPTLSSVGVLDQSLPQYNTRVTLTEE